MIHAKRDDTTRMRPASHDFFLISRGDVFENSEEIFRYFCLFCHALCIRIISRMQEKTRQIIFFTKLPVVNVIFYL